VLNASIHNPNVVCIVDSFTLECFGGVCELHPMHLHDWSDSLNRLNPKLLVVSSTSQEWLNHPSEVLEIMRTSRMRGVFVWYIAVNVAVEDSIRSASDRIYPVSLPFPYIQTDSAAARLYRRRFEETLQTITDPHGQEQERKQRSVTVITCTIRDETLSQVFDNYDRQTWDNKELIIILNNDSIALEKWEAKAKLYPNVSVYRIPEKQNLGACLNYGISVARHDYIAKMDDDDYYGPNYLSDLLFALRTSKADIVGKKAFFVYFEANMKLMLAFKGIENSFQTHLVGATLLFKKKIFENVQFQTKMVSGTDANFLANCVSKGYKLYASDRFNYVCYRKEDKGRHTWKISDRDLRDFFCSQVPVVSGDHRNAATI